MVGTSFPDIRYLGVISREKTHFNSFCIQDVVETEDSFMAGLKFHLLVDRVREQFMKNNDAYSLFPKSPYQTQAVKFFEDQQLWKKINHWSKIIDYFNHISEGELQYGLEIDDIVRWHKTLQSYLAQSPVEATIAQFVTDIGQPESMSTEIIEVIKKSEQHRAKALVEKFYSEFNLLISQEASSIQLE